LSGFRFPGNSHRTTVIGRTGTGKTLFGYWLLANAPFDTQPYIIVDFKHDRLIGQSDRIREIGLHEKLPKEPGVYVVRPHPVEDESEMENWLWKVWQHENIGLWIDEGYSLPTNSRAFQGILVQGRSKRIPVITLTQRPKWLSRFVFSEADFYAYFTLNDEDDVKRVQQMIGRKSIDLSSDTPRFHSRWYDVSENKVFLMKPVPKEDRLVEMLDARLKPRTRFF
jgi:hypothetical protein